MKLLSLILLSVATAFAIGCAKDKNNNNPYAYNNGYNTYNNGYNNGYNNPYNQNCLPNQGVPNNSPYYNGYNNYNNTNCSTTNMNGRYDQFGNFIPNFNGGYTTGGYSAGGFSTGGYINTYNYQSAYTCPNGTTGAYFGGVYSCMSQANIWEINANAAYNYSGGYYYYNGGSGSDCEGKDLAWSAAGGGALGYGLSGGDNGTALAGAGLGALICVLK
ncbi:hypothetical protein N9W41_00820 [bacterium]|nr:hypothetical protein [bacterium]